METEVHASARAVARGYFSEGRSKGRRPFHNLPRVVFLCGGALSPDPAAQPKRCVLERYMREELHCRVFYAEHVWQSLSRDLKANTRSSLLELERDFARYADAIVLVLESAGAICELGAFAMEDSLRAKLIVLHDRKHKHETSFIQAGPLTWLRTSANASSPCDVISVPFDAIESSREPLKRSLERAARLTGPLGPEGVIDRSAMLFVLQDLVYIFGAQPLRKFVAIVAEALKLTSEPGQAVEKLTKATHIAAGASLITVDRSVGENDGRVSLNEAQLDDCRKRNADRPRMRSPVDLLRLRWLSYCQATPLPRIVNGSPS